jgi:hypothetical protein
VPESNERVTAMMITMREATESTWDIILFGLCVGQVVKDDDGVYNGRMSYAGTPLTATTDTPRGAFDAVVRQGNALRGCKPKPQGKTVTKFVTVRVSRRKTKRVRKLIPVVRPEPHGRSVRTVSGGLPSLGKRHS